MNDWFFRRVAAWMITHMPQFWCSERAQRKNRTGNLGSPDAFAALVKSSRFGKIAPFAAGWMKW